MKLTPEQQAALRRAVESYELPENYGQEWTAFMFAAGIAQERARCLAECVKVAESVAQTKTAIVGLLWEVAEHIDYDAARAAQGWPAPSANKRPPNA